MAIPHDPPVHSTTSLATASAHPGFRAIAAVFALAVATTGCAAERSPRSDAAREEAARSDPTPMQPTSHDSIGVATQTVAVATLPPGGVADPVAVPQRPAAAGKAHTVASALVAYDFDGDPVRIELPAELREVSGLAMDAGDHLFAHQDERAVVFQIDPASGEIDPSFQLGRNGLRGDFEGIAIAGDRMFLVSSEGVLYSFTPPGPDGETRYERTRLDTARRCSEIEGLDYDARADELLLACKFTRGRELRDRLVVFAFSLASNTLLEEPRLNVPLDALERLDLRAELSPSGIAVHPITGTLFVLAARQNLIVELTPAGELLDAERLRRQRHPQPEGIAFAADGTLYIADEAPSRKATLAVYRPDVGQFRPAAR